MKRVMLIAAVMAGLGIASGLGMQEGRQPEVRVESGARFRAIDIFVDSGETALAAYQVDVKAVGSAKVTLVGVEGGEHAAFASPPHYDPAALHEDQLRDRIVLAAFNTGADLPAGKARVARIHVQVEGGEPAIEVVVVAAAGADGTRIEAKATAGESR